MYEFKKNHPDIDLEPFLQHTTLVFQNYVERGLQHIESEKETKSRIQNSTGTRGKCSSVKSYFLNFYMYCWF